MHGSQGAPAQQCAGATQLGDEHLGHPATDAGDGHHPLDYLGDRAQQHLDLLIGLGDRGLQPVDVGQHLRDQQPVMLDPEPVGQRLPQRRNLRTQPALRQLRQHRRVLLTGQQGGQDRPAGLAQDRRGDRGQLDPRVLQHLLQPLNGPGPLLGQPSAVSGQIPQQPNRTRRHETRAHQPVLDQLRDPQRIGDIGLAAGHIMQMLGVDDPHREVVLEDVVDRFPIHPGRFHPDQFHPLHGQPGSKLLELPGGRSERSGF
jgi:hypothetical protein